MHEINLTQLDLNLLMTLHALLKERSVTRAGETLGLSQSATSHALKRLRKLFDDPLLVRTSQGMIPTPRAENLVEPLQQILSKIEQLIQTPTFDPKTAEGTIQITATDYATVVILPTILKRIAEEAPHLDIECHHWREDTLESLRNGAIDLALGGQNPPDSNEFDFQQLFVEDFVSIVRADHPATQSEFNIETFLSWPHVLITVTNSRMTYIDEMLGKLQGKRRIFLRLPHFLSAVLIVAKTDLILTLPRRLAMLFTEFANLSVLDSPIELDNFNYIQVWHKRRQHEPMHTWLRELIASQTQKI
jgi:DNA-binding transcriptional LysR family regulator